MYATYSQVGSFFLPWLYGDRVTDFLFIFQPWEILLEHNDKIKKKCMLEKKIAFFQLHLVRARDSQSKCLKLKCAKNFNVQLCQEDDKIDNFPPACIQKKTGQLASLYTVFPTPIWIYWKFRASRLFSAPFVFELVFSLSSLWYHFGITLAYFQTSLSPNAMYSIFDQFFEQITHNFDLLKSKN